MGGNRIKSNQWTFRFNLGPGDNGEFHEIVCIKMNDVTAGFGSYDLSEISEEYREQQAEAVEKDAVLPERVGGSRVHLLLGIKNTKLDPVLVKILPSGVAVYRSPFKDIYGSRMIFAGPHKSFTKDDNGVKIEMSNAVFFIRDLIPTQEEISDESIGMKDEFFGHSVLAAEAGKGVAEELLIDLDVKPTEPEKFRFQSRIQTLDNLETLTEELLIDMEPAELERFRFQSRTQTPML